MTKKLSEMTLEELWQLFPIVLTEHQPQWKEWYREEEALLLSKLQGIARISHIGSTIGTHAGPGLVGIACFRKA